jgi:O-antigen biosynthesis protein
VVFTPHASLVHDKSSGASTDADAHDANRLQMRWDDRLARDPYYNPNLSRDTPDYEPKLTASAQTISARAGTD